MKFYAEEFRRLRKQKGITINDLASRIDSNRTSISNWERGYQTPSEKRIRMLASGLDISVSEISDLENYSAISKKLPQLKQSWLELAESSSETLRKIQEQHFSSLTELFKIVEESSIIVKALLKSLPISFYIKSPCLHYITANNHFYREVLKSYGCSNIVGLCDKDIFPAREALANEKEDQDVISSSVPIINREQFIPGTRKKKTALVTKTPIFDKLGKIIGLIGIFIDVTDRKDEEKRRLLLEGAINKLPYAVYVGNYKGNKFHYSLLSKGIEKVSGYTVKNFIQHAQGMSDFICEDDRDRFDVWRTTMKFPGKIEVKANTHDGIKWLEFEREKDKIMGKEYLFGLLRDITERKEQDLKVQEREYLLNQLPDIIWFGTYTEDFEFLFLNDAVSDITGIPKNKYYEASCEYRKLIHPDDKNKVLDWYRNTTFPKTMEYRLITHKGIKWVLDNQYQATLNNRVFFFGITRDITDRRRNENTIKHLEMAINSISSALSIFDLATHKYLYTNKFAERLWGYPCSTEKFLKDENHLFWLDNLANDEDKEKMLHYIETGEFPRQFEYQYKAPDGKIRWIESIASVTKYLDKDCLTSISRDITERKQKEEIHRLVDSHLGATSTAVIIHNDDRVIYATQALADLYGYPLEKLEKGYFDFRIDYCIHPEDRAKQKNMQQSYTVNKKWPIVEEFRIIRPDGEICWIRTTVSPLEYFGEECYAVFAVNITRDKELVDLRQLVFDTGLVSEGLVVIGLEKSNYLYLNKAIERIYEYPLEKFYKGDQAFWYNTCLHPEDRADEIKCINSKNYPEKRRFRIVRPSGEVRYIESILSSVINYEEQECVVIIDTDITEKINYENEILNLKNQLKNRDTSAG